MFDSVEICKEFVKNCRSQYLCLIKLRAVRSLLGEL